MRPLSWRSRGTVPGSRSYFKSSCFQDGPKMAQDVPEEPKTAPRQAQDGPKMAQNHPKMAQDGPKMCQNRPRLAQHGLLGPSKAVLEGLGLPNA